MKKFVHNLLLFLPVALVGYLLSLCLLGDLGWVRTGRTQMGGSGHLNMRVKDIHNYHDVDVLFLGSSHCYRTFDTRFYRSKGLSCFNLGSSNQTPMQTYVLLRQYLDSLNPQLVVFEVHPDIMDHDGVESAVDVLANVPLSRDAIRMAWTSRNMKEINTCLYSLYSQKVCHRLERFHEDSVSGTSVYVPGGFVYNTHKCFEVKHYPHTALSIKAAQMEALKRCIALFEERGIRYLLVEVQDAEQLRTTIVNHPWFERQMSALGPYYYEVLPLVDVRHFENSQHLWGDGVRFFNRWFYNDVLLSDYIETNLLIPSL